jgi:hypothetical protein
MAVDAFSQTWSKLKAYAFPPFSLIGKCLAKTGKERAELLLIAPTWQAQPWFPRLLQMAVAKPILLPPHPKLLLSPKGEPHPLMGSSELRLAAWKISGNERQQEAFRAELPNCVYKQEGQGQYWLTMAPGKSGLAGVAQGKLIQFEPLWAM